MNVTAKGTLQTPLHLVVRRRDAFAVGRLLHKGADVNVRNASGKTPLLLAANQWRKWLSLEQETVLKLLLAKKGIDVDAVAEPQQRTALHLACIAKSENAASLLLKHNADPQRKDKQGRNASELLKTNYDSSSAEIEKAIEDALKSALTQDQALLKMPEPAPLTPSNSISTG